MMLYLSLNPQFNKVPEREHGLFKYFFNWICWIVIQFSHILLSYDCLLKIFGNELYTVGL